MSKEFISEEEWIKIEPDGLVGFADTHDYEDTVSELFESYTGNVIEPPPGEVVCYKRTLPTWDAASVCETVCEWLDESNHNEQGEYWSDHCSDSDKKIFEEKMQPIIDEFIAANGWRNYTQTKYRIDITAMVEEYKRMLAE
jgi:hypothetical protein